MWALDPKNPATVTPNSGRPDFSVTFNMVNDSETFAYTEAYVTDLTALPRLAANWIRQHNLFLIQSSAPIDPTSLISAVNEILNPDTGVHPLVTAQREYQAIKSKIELLQRLSDEGGLAADDASIVDAKTSLTAAAATLAVIVKQS